MRREALASHFRTPRPRKRLLAGLTFKQHQRLKVGSEIAFPLYFNVHPSARVFLFAALVCLASALISGLPPAFQPVRRSLVDALKQGGRGDTQGGHSRRISGVLVVAETGLALAALVMLGLFLRSLYGLQNTPAGFDHRNVTVCRLFLSTNNYTPSQEQQFSRRLRERLLAAPGVTGAAYSDSIPLGFGLGKWTRVVVDGYASRPGAQPGRAPRPDSWQPVHDCGNGEGQQVFEPV